MRDIIRSSDNQFLKKIRKVQDRKKCPELVYIEGLRIVTDCLLSGGRCDSLILSERKVEEGRSIASEYGIDDASVYVLDDKLFDKISQTVNSQGIAMICECPQLLNDLPLRGNDVICVLENVQDPGNVGTIIRMADAFDMSAVILTKGSCDPFGDKALRASMGSAWHIPVVMFDDEELLFGKLADNGITSIAMHLHGDDLFGSDIKFPVAFFIGNEGKGLSEFASSRCTSKVKIPMPGKAESLNAASAASVIGYELMRRRLT